MTLNVCTICVLSSGLFYHLNTGLNEQKEYSYHVKQTAYIKRKIIFLCDVEDPPYKNKNKNTDIFSITQFKTKFNVINQALLLLHFFVCLFFKRVSLSSSGTGFVDQAESFFFFFEFGQGM